MTTERADQIDPRIQALIDQIIKKGLNPKDYEYEIRADGSVVKYKDDDMVVYPSPLEKEQQE